MSFAMSLSMRRCVVGSHSISQLAIRGKMGKKGAKKGGKTAEQNVSEYEKRRDMMAGLMDYIEPKPREASKLSVEEIEVETAMKREWSRHCMKLDNELMHGQQMRYKLRQNALARLRRIDEKLWDAAIVPDRTPFPLAREVPVDTPPIENFVPISNTSTK